MGADPEFMILKLHVTRSEVINMELERMDDLEVHMQIANVDLKSIQVQ